MIAPVRTVAGKRGFREIKREVFRRIRDNEWGPGTQLPGEVALAEQFGCARATVNRAMQELSDDGIIERRRKGGSHVKLAPVRQFKFEIPLVRAEIESRGAVYRYQLISRLVEKTPKGLAKRLSLDADGSLLHIKCLHFSGEQPYQFEDRRINLAAVPRAEHVGFSTAGPNEWLVSEVPYTNAEVRFSATLASKSIAGLLQTAEGEPIFRVERTTWLAQVPVTNVLLYYARGYEMIARY